MKEVAVTVTMLIFLCTSCVQGGHNPTYIISEHSKGVDSSSELEAW